MAPDVASLAARDDRARRIVLAAAKGGSGLLGVGTAIAGAAIGVLAIQATLARRAIGTRRSAAPYVDGRYPPPGDRPPRGTSLRLVVLGDSGAAGLGADHRDTTPGGVIAMGLAAASGRTVSLTSVAVIGARSVDLAAQVDRILPQRPHVAVIMIGANDVTHLVRPQESVRLLVAAVRRLRDEGTEVVVGTCPDLGTVRPIAAPLRQMARRMCRELAAAQFIGVRESGGRPVALAQLVGHRFDSEPDLFFSADRFHPSVAGYAACAQELLPEVLAAVGLGHDLPALPST